MNSTSKWSAQNLASKETNRRRGSFPRGHDQRSRFQFFLNMYCLDASTSLVVYENTLLSFVLNQRCNWSILEESSKCPGPRSRTVI